MSKFEDFIDQFSIPAQPEAFLEFSKRVNQPEPEITDVVEALRSDPSLYTAVLATANSAFFRVGKETTSLTRAVIRLGLDKLKCIVRLVALKNSISTIGRLDRFWDTAVEVAEVTALLTSKFTIESKDDAYSLGMIHDCGIPLMMEHLKSYTDFLKLTGGTKPDQLHLLEQEEFGFDHYEVGAEVANQWSLPIQVCAAVHGQSNIEAFLTDTLIDDSSKNLLCCLLLAKDVSQSFRRYWRAKDDRTTPYFLPIALQYLGISDIEYIDLRDDILDSMEDAQL